MANKHIILGCEIAFLLTLNFFEAWLIVMILGWFGITLTYWKGFIIAFAIWLFLSDGRKARMVSWNVMRRCYEKLEKIERRENNPNIYHDQYH